MSRSQLMQGGSTVKFIMPKMRTQQFKTVRDNNILTFFKYTK